MVLRHDPTFDEAFDDLFAVAERVARRIAGPTESEDIAADVMGRTFARWSRVNPLPYRRAWVARVAFNEALDAHRRANRRSGVGIAATPSRDLADDLAVRAALNEALGKLPKRQREVVALRYLADLTESDTASLLGVTVGSVKQHARRALEAMRERLGNDATFGWEE